jgi:very-short-patch-repair endonuclease
LRSLFRGVYWVGESRVTRRGLWMAAVLACGRMAVLSHGTAAALWGLLPPARELHVSAPWDQDHPGITTHRRGLPLSDMTSHIGIPVTGPVCTLIDVAHGLSPRQLEGAVSEADTLDLIDPEALRVELDGYRGRTGLPKLKRVLDRHTYVMTDSMLERMLLPIARRAGLPLPVTQAYVNGYRVDFYWPDLGLIVEANGLRYHRTPAQQAEDARRGHAHAAAGLVTVPFTYAQIRFEPGYVEEVLTAVARRLAT